MFPITLTQALLRGYKELLQGNPSTYNMKS